MGGDVVGDDGTQHREPALIGVHVTSLWPVSGTGNDLSTESNALGAQAPEPAKAPDTLVEHAGDGGERRL